MFAKSLTKKYDGKAVVDSVSFELPKGKVTALMEQGSLRLWE